MNIEEYYNYCLEKPFVEESFPFDESVLVFKLGGKIFALANVDQFSSVNLKCDPEKAVELRETYNGVKPGYHMNKKHWNTIDVASDVPNALIFELIDHSYDLIYNSLTKKVKNELQAG